MSIGAKPWEGGGVTSSNLNDVTNNGATTTNAITVGGVTIGTEYSLPVADGTSGQVLRTDGAGNVSFATVDVTGALQYQGSYNATTATPDLTTAEKGDFYIVSVAGSLAGVTLGVGDHIVFNQDASSPVTSAMFDKIDNTDAVASVNGQTGVVVLAAGDVGALAAGDNVSSLTNDANYVASGDNVSVLTNDANYVASGDNVSVLTNDANYVASGDNVSSLTNDAGYLTSAPVTSVNALTGVVVVSGNDIAADHTAANYTPLNSNLDGHLSGIDTALGASASPTLDGVTTNGNTTANDIEVGGVQVSGDITASSNLTRTIGAEATRFVTYYGDMNGAVRFKAKNDSGAQMTKGQVVYIKGVSGTVPTVGLADADNAAARPAFGLVYATANDQAEVQVVSFGNLEGVNTASFSAGDTLYLSTTPGALTNSAPTGETAALQNIGRVVRSDASAGIIIVGGAGRSAATPNLDSGKIFLGNGSNQAVSTAISSINLSSFNDDLSYQPLDAGLTSISGLTTAADKMIYTTASDTYAVTDLTSAGRALLDDADASAQRTTLGLGTAATSASTDFLASTAGLDDLSDVAYTAGAGIDNYVLTYDHSTTSWGAEAAPTASPASETVAGVIEIATNAEATAATATDKALVPSNISSIALSSFNDDLSYQPLDAGLTSISGLTTAADKMIYTTASDTYAVADLTSAGRALLDDADASAQRTTLGLGTAATSASTDFLASTAGLDDLSDVAYTAGAGIDGYVLTYDHSTTSWGAEPGGGTVALDGIDPGTGAATLSTAGNITIDATANDSDIIFRGTDGGVDTTFLTIDGSDAGTLIANNDLKLQSDSAAIILGADGDVQLRHLADEGLRLTMSTLAQSTQDPKLYLESGGTNSSSVGPFLVYEKGYLSPAAGHVLGGSSYHTSTASIFAKSQCVFRATTHADYEMKVRSNDTDDQVGIAIQGQAAAAPKVKICDAFYLPTTDGTSGQVIQTDGSGTLSWGDKSQVVDDTTPQLGGDLDVNSHAITSASNGNVEITPNGTGVVVLGGNTNSATLRFYDEAGTNYIALKAPADADISADTTFTLPVADGTSGQVLQTNGSGALSWVNQGGGGGASYTYSAVSAASVTGQAWYHYSVDTSSNAVTINLPALAGLTDGDEIRVKLRNATNTLTLDPNGTETIDGSLTRVMNTQYEAITLVAGSTEWEII
jgi:hypothetical protein